MDRQGRESILEALRPYASLEENPFGAAFIFVNPEPEEGENARFLEIEADGMTPQQLLNALDKAKLMGGKSLNQRSVQLEVVPTSGYSSMTFEDINTR